jgi:uncharacterized protein (TIGR03118 family)
MVWNSVAGDLFTLFRPPSSIEKYAVVCESLQLSPGEECICPETAEFGGSLTEESTMNLFSHALRRGLVLAALASGLAAGTVFAANSYQVRNLVSDGGVPAEHRDDNLKNGWGISMSATSPIWVADNGTGKATLYDGLGNMLSLVVTVPSASGSGDGTPTGNVFNVSNDFVVHSGTAAAPARFIFASEDGLISGWSPGVDATHAIHAVFMSAAVYKGLALASNSGVNMLYAADFHGHKIDVFGPNFAPQKLPGAFVDPNVPANFSPFNIVSLAGRLYVSYAQKEEDGDDEVAGPGLGIVDVFDTGGHLLQRITAGGTLNAPWGMAIAPANFGDFSNRLLVGNFGDGTINAFDLNTGVFQGQLRTPNGQILVIDGLWGIAFGNGSVTQNLPSNTLFFAAGPNDEENGVFGRIDVASP